MKKKIYVKGPVLSQSGYGEQSRFALRALRSREDLFDIYIHPIPWGRTGWIWEDNEFRNWIDERITLTAGLVNQKQLQPDMSLQITIPNEFERICSVNIGYTAGIETNKVAPQWLEKSNEMDKILVVSNHAKETLEKTVYQAQNTNTGEVFDYSLTTPVDVVWERTPYQEAQPIQNLNLETDFNFLMVSQVSPRKNFVNSLRWWIEEFIDQEVGLVLKCNMKCNSIMDYEMFHSSIKKVIDDYPDRSCKIYILHGDLSAGQMTSLYTHPKIKAIVNIAHGEGFGLPLYEAARSALPVITIGWSGQTDFLRHEQTNYFEEVKHTLQKVQPQVVWDGVIQADSQWAYADQGSYKMALRRTFKTWHKSKERAEKLKTIIDDKFSEERLYKLFVDSVLGFDSSIIADTDSEIVMEFD